MTIRIQIKIVYASYLCTINYTIEFGKYTALDQNVKRDVRFTDKRIGVLKLTHSFDVFTIFWYLVTVFVRKNVLIFDREVWLY